MIPSRPFLLDLCCGAGGAARGYHQAGFVVVGVDKDPQPEYPFEFHQADALEFLDGLLTRRERPRWPFAAIHASFPCQAHSDQAAGRGIVYDDLIGPGRDRLLALGLPFVLENVDTAPIRCDLRLCGFMFGLPLIKHRHFELHGFTAPEPIHPKCRGAVSTGEAISVVGTGGGATAGDGRGRRKRFEDMSVVRSRQLAMGTPWITDPHMLAEAIPPAYTAWVGSWLARSLVADERREVIA